MGRYIHRKRGKEREEKKREKKQTNKKTKKHREKIIVIVQNVIHVLLFVPLLIRVKPTSLRPSMCQSQLETERITENFCKWSERNTENTDLHQKFTGPYCMCCYQVYCYKHIMAPLKDIIVCEWVGGCLHVCVRNSKCCHSYLINGNVVITLKNESQALPE